MKTSERNQFREIRNCAPLEALWGGGAAFGKNSQKIPVFFGNPPLVQWRSLPRQIRKRSSGRRISLWSHSDKKTKKKTKKGKNTEKKKDRPRQIRKRSSGQTDCTEEEHNGWIMMMMLVKVLVMMMVMMMMMMMVGSWWWCWWRWSERLCLARRLYTSCYLMVSNSIARYCIVGFPLNFHFILLV